MHNKHVVPINLTVAKTCNEFFLFMFSQKAWDVFIWPLISPDLEEVMFYFPETEPLLCLRKSVLQKITFFQKNNKKKKN